MAAEVIDWAGPGEARLVAVAEAHQRVAVLHGVNLGALGKRDPEHYGTLTLPELERQIKVWALELGLGATFFQTNGEGAFVDHLHRVPERADAVIINAGAWTHYSWALRDALEITGLPAVEVHLSDVANREQWRHLSVFDGVVIAKVSGKGPQGYREALEIVKRELSD